MRNITNPSVIIIVLTVINLLNYLDRYILAALLPAIQKDLHLTDSQLGTLGSAFILMYFIISPFFGWLGDLYQRNYIISFGVFFWSLATAWSGMAKNFTMMLLARFGVGIGEAAYGTVTPAIISDLYPLEKRTKIFAWFFMAIPVGSALGFLLGGILESAFNWRVAFYLVGLPGILLALLLLFFRDPPRGQFDRHEPKQSNNLIDAYRYLWSNKNYVFIVLGYTAHTFALGGIAHWMSTFVVRTFDVKLVKANLLIGSITVAGGFIGTFLGGWLGSKWQQRSPDGLLKMAAVSIFLAVPLVYFVLVTNNLLIFGVSLFLIELCIFLSTSPVNAELVNCVSPYYRASAGAVCIFVIHILGDAISPTLIGVISQQTNIKMALAICCPLAFFVGGMLWTWKVLAHFHSASLPQGKNIVEKFQAHRGFHCEGATENSLEAFQAASKNKIQMIEIDIRLSSDKVPFVFHDESLKRIFQIDKNISEVSSQELKNIGIPTLEAAFDSYSGKINIEIKSNHIFDAGIEAAIHRVIQAKKAQARVIISSFNPFVLRRMAKINNSIIRALLVTQDPGPSNNFLLRKMYLAFLARPHMLNLDEQTYTTETANSLKRRKIPVAIWTINDQNKAHKMFHRGAISVISDSKDVLLQQ